MRDFIERLQAKPEHERKRITFLTSAGVTALVAIGWIAAVASSDAIALKSGEGNSITSTQDFGALVAETGSGVSALLGAVGASGGQTGTAQVGELRIVDGGSSSTISGEEDVDERTVIPF